MWSQSTLTLWFPDSRFQFPEYKMAILNALRASWEFPFVGKGSFYRIAEIGILKYSLTDTNTRQTHDRVETQLSHVYIRLVRIYKLALRSYYNEQIGVPLKFIPPKPVRNEEKIKSCKYNNVCFRQSFCFAFKWAPSTLQGGYCKLQFHDSLSISLIPVWPYKKVSCIFFTSTQNS